VAHNSVSSVRVVSTYSCFSAVAFSEFIEIDEELLDADSVFADESLKSLLDIELAAELLGNLVVAGVTVFAPGESGHNVTEGDCLN